MNSDERSRLRDLHHREQFALRDAVRRMAADEATMERELEVLDKDIGAAEHRIEANLKDEHWGRDSERPLFWKARASDRDARGRPDR